MEATNQGQAAPKRNLYRVTVVQTAHVYIEAESETGARREAYRVVDSEDFEDDYADVRALTKENVGRLDRSEIVYSRGVTVGEWLDSGGDVERFRKEQKSAESEAIEAWFSAAPSEPRNLLTWHLTRPACLVFSDYRDDDEVRSGEGLGDAFATDGYGGIVVAGATVETRGTLEIERVKKDLSGALSPAGTTTREKIKAWLDARVPTTDIHAKPIEAVRIGDSHLLASLVRAWVWSAARIHEGPIKVERGGPLDMVRFTIGDVTACVMPMRLKECDAPALETE